ncbi:hypothetical protein PTI98_013389 [Pleurotus ostreatus]|nr:hypothetical protein PTI98_013389 [Pleurotus ostreatus]
MKDKGDEEGRAIRDTPIPLSRTQVESKFTPFLSSILRSYVRAISILASPFQGCLGRKGLAIDQLRDA